MARTMALLKRWTRRSPVAASLVVDVVALLLCSIIGLSSCAARQRS